MIPAYAILAAVFVAITVRQLLELKIPIWKIMFAGAVFALVLGDISVPAAFSSINFGIIAFLIGMFLIGEALQQSGYLDYHNRIARVRGFPRHALIQSNL